MDWGCNDYVSRADVLEIAAETGALETQGRVKELPAADVRAVVCGEWLDERWRKNPLGSSSIYSCDATCSVCKNHGDVRIKRGKKEWEISSPRCPICGAFMSNATEENCIYHIQNYEFGSHDKGDACALGYKDGYTEPYSCDGVCRKYTRK